MLEMNLIRKKSTTEKKTVNDQELEKLLEEKRKEIDQRTDLLGLRIDEKIKDVIAAFNLADIPTSSSCHGHYGELDSDGDKQSFRNPYIHVKEPDEPEERFHNQNKILQKIADKYGLTFKEVNIDWSDDPTRRALAKKAHDEAFDLMYQQGETEEWKKWYAKIKEWKKRMQGLLDEFYQNRPTPEEDRIKIGRLFGAVLLEIGQDVDSPAENTDPDEIKKAMDEQEKKLGKYQQEFKAFADFLLAKKFGLRKKK